MNGVGEPCAGEPHARFEGEGLDTDETRPRRRMPRPHPETDGRCATRLPSTTVPHRPSPLPDSRATLCGRNSSPLKVRSFAARTAISNLGQRL
jgi:hypothetical protein